MIIHITHCSGIKNDRFENTNKKVAPDKLYTSKKTQRFILKCKEKKVDWAIFSDQYGVWFPNEKHEWYEKHPDDVTDKEFEKLLKDFDSKLSEYDEIWFYYNPGRFHPLYRKLLKKSKLKKRIYQFTHVDEIGYYNDQCEWLHRHIEKLPLIKYPFDINSLPKNGIYFFYERGESWGHGKKKPRIVRIGTSNDGNFRSRISEHYQLKNRIYKFSKNKPKPSDRSVFRTNLGLALLKRRKDKYLSIWGINFTSRMKRDKYGYRRVLNKEMKLEEEITNLIRAKFSFRHVIIEDEDKRKGSNSLESSFIGTVSNCNLCKQTGSWLGNHSTKQKIKESGLWLTQHLYDESIKAEDKKYIIHAIRNTKDWILK